MPIYKMTGRQNGLQKYRVRINYVDTLGVSRQADRVAYGLDAAKELEGRLMREIRQESPATRITLRALFDEYKAAKKHELRETTLSKTERILDLHVFPSLENHTLQKITVPVLAKWKVEINEKALSVASKRNIYAYLRALLNYGVQVEHISKSPLSKVGNFKDATETRREMNFYTTEEFKKYISVARQHAESSASLSEWGYYVFFALAFYTGLRKGEIHSLRWMDIEDGYLSVKRSITQKLKGDDRITPPKNRSSYRTLQIPIPLINILDEHKVRCQQQKGFDESFLVCGGLKALRDTTIENRNIRFAELAGIKKIRIHDFRHSHASVLANNGINIQEIARRLGHSKIEITWNTYSHLYPKEEERAIAVLNNI